MTIHRDSKGRFIKKNLPTVFVETKDRSIYDDDLYALLYIKQGALDLCDRHKNVKVEYAALHAEWGSISSKYKEHRYTNISFSGIKGTDGREKIKEYLSKVIDCIVDAQKSQIIKGYRIP